MNFVSGLQGGRRWRAGLATAALHGLLLAGLMGVGGGGSAPTAALQAVAVRLLTESPKAAPPVMPIVTPPLSLPRPALPSLPVVDIAQQPPPEAGATAAPAPAAVAAASPPAVAPASPSVLSAATVAPVAAPSPANRGANRTATRADCPAADYPALLRDRGVEGLVRVRVQVGSRGEALAVQLAAGSGFRLLDEAALQQARACRYLPALQDGEAVASWVEFPSRFSLQ